MTKQCTVCEIVKPFNAFGKDKRNLNGLQSRCNECKKEQGKQSAALRAAGIGLKLISEKTCNKCNQTKGCINFFKDIGIADGYATICKECKMEGTYKWREENREQYNAKMREYRKNNPHKFRESHLRRSYSLTTEQFVAMLNEQGNSCRICKKVFAQQKDTRVDHNHITGEVRGILCAGCNRAIAIMDNVELYAAARQYLKIP